MYSCYCCVTIKLNHGSSLTDNILCPLLKRAKIAAPSMTALSTFAHVTQFAIEWAQTPKMTSSPHQKFTNLGRFYLGFKANSKVYFSILFSAMILNFRRALFFQSMVVEIGYVT